MEHFLKQWAERHWREAVRIGAVVDMSGHSGKVYAFAVEGPGWRQECVIRLAPAGVAHKGSTDVLRQVPLLKALHAAGVRVPDVIDASGDPELFGVPYLVMERLPGRPLIMGPDAGPSWLPANERQRAHELAAAELTTLHRFDLERCLPDWEPAKPLHEDLAFWADILIRGKQEDWITTGLPVRDQLLAALPRHYAWGLVHGDYQTNNLLYVGEGESLAIAGIVDWEVAAPGATELDLAWFLMMNDDRAWHPVEQRGGLDLDALVARYEEAMGRSVANLSWFRAFACFRFAAIAALNIRLHRTGRKEDPAWERAAATVPIMFARAEALLDGAQ